MSYLSGSSWLPCLMFHHTANMRICRPKQPVHLNVDTANTGRCCHRSPASWGWWAGYVASGHGCLNARNTVRPAAGKQAARARAHSYCPSRLWQVRAVCAGQERRPRLVLWAASWHRSVIHSCEFISCESCNRRWLQVMPNSVVDRAASAKQVASHSCLNMPGKSGLSVHGRGKHKICSFDQQRTCRHWRPLAIFKMRRQRLSGLQGVTCCAVASFALMATAHSSSEGLLLTKKTPGEVSGAVGEPLCVENPKATSRPASALQAKTFQMPRTAAAAAALAALRLFLSSAISASCCRIRGDSWQKNHICQFKSLVTHHNIVCLQVPPTIGRCTPSGT